jgi:hypothetical protein
MNNNWIEKGYAALEGDETPYGMLWLKSEEMANWREIALSRIKAVLCDRILDFAKANPYITIGALFSRRYGVTKNEFNMFVNDVVALFEGGIPHLCSLDYGRSPKRNMVIVNFSKTTLSELMKKKDELRKRYQ